MAENRYLKWLSSRTASVYWHDSAIVEELDAAMANGAVGMTTNPFLIASTLKAQPDFWRGVLPGVPDDVQGDARAEEWIAQVTGWLAKNKLAPLRGSGKFAGYVCAQTILKVDGQTQSGACPGSFLYVAGSQFGKELLEQLIGVFHAIRIVAACHQINVGVDVSKANRTGADLEQPFKCRTIPHEVDYSIQ